LQRLRAGRLGGMRALELGRRARDLLGKLGELALVALDVRTELREGGARLGQVAALALPQLARMLDRLLEARHLRADLVVAALHARDALARRAVLCPLGLDGRLRGALVRERRLHLDLAGAGSAVVHLGAAVELLQAKREQLRRQAPLLVLQ